MILTALNNMFYTYHICPIQRVLRGGDDRVCVYLLVKNDIMSLTSKNSILLTVDKQDPRSCPIHSHCGEVWLTLRRGVYCREGVKQGSSFDLACFHTCFATYV